MNKSLKTVLLFVVGMTVISYLLNKCSSDKSSKPSLANKVDTASAAVPKIEVAEPASNWRYEETQNEMDGIKSYYATATSSNEIEFEFPYQGGSTASVILRNTNGKNEVMLAISKGQFIASFGGADYIRAKFDNDKPMSLSYGMPSDGSSNTIFLGGTSKFMAKLKVSKKLIIEAEFYDAGTKTMRFDIEGLKWQY